MKSRMTHALQPLSGDMMGEQRVEEIVDNFMKKNTENYNTGVLLTVGFIRLSYSYRASFNHSTNRITFTMIQKTRYILKNYCK